MTTYTVPFIGRQDELRLVDQMLEQAGSCTVLCVDGPGGIGKTRLLQEIAQRYAAAPHLLSTGILDFDLPHLRVADNLWLEVALRLGQRHFAPYLERFRDWQQMQHSGFRYERLEQEAQAVKETFRACYREAARQERMLVLMDTLEDVQDTVVWNDVLELIQMAPNVVLVMAGRRVKALAAVLRPLLGDQAVRLVELRPLNAGESIAYIETKEKQLHLSLPPDLRAKIVQVTAGRPILIDLASEWLGRHIPFDWLADRPLEELRALSEEKRHELEAALVGPIEQLPATLYELVLHLAYVYPMDTAMMGALQGISGTELEQALDDLRRLAFIKLLPDNTYSLHDEMRDLIDQHIWNDIDPQRTRRRQISVQMAAYFAERASAVMHALSEASDEEPGHLTAFLQRSTLRQQYWVLRSQQFSHVSRVSLHQAIELFTQLFDEATQTYQFPVRADLLDRTLVFADQFDADQRYNVNIRRVRFLIESGRRDDIREAQELLEAMMPVYSDGGEHELDMLTRLANCAIKTGQVPAAPPLLERARAITIATLPAWLDKVENTLGLAYRLLGRLDLAYKTYQSALKHSDDQATIASIYNNLGFVECLQGEYEAGLSFCQQARAIRARLNLRLEVGMSCATIADIYRHWGRYDDAIKQAEEAISIFETLQDREWLARVYARRGAARRLNADGPRQLDEAIADLQKSLDQNYLTEMPYATHVMGCVYWDKQDFDKALDWFAQSEAMLEERFDIWNHMNNLIGTAEIYYAKWLQERRPEYRKRILASASQIRREAKLGFTLSHQIGRITRLLGDLAYAEGRFDQALRHYKQAYALLGGRYAGYGRRTLQDELDALAMRIEGLPARAALAWCDALEEVWSSPRRDIRNREALLSICRIHRAEARLKLKQETDAV